MKRWGPRTVTRAVGWDMKRNDANSLSAFSEPSRIVHQYTAVPARREIVFRPHRHRIAWAGILMPSVDRVGRYFPLTLAVKIDDSQALPNLFINAAEWFGKLEQLALTALEDDFDLTEFDRSLQEQILACRIL